MPTQIDYPSGIGALSDWGLEGGADKMIAVATNDGNTSFIYADSGGRQVQQLYTFPLLDGVTDPVTSATLTMLARKQANGAGGQSLYTRWNSVRGATNFWSTLDLSGAYTTCSEAFPAALTLAEVNGQHGVEMWAAGGPSNKCEIWVTQVYRTVVYEPLGADPGDFAYIMGSLLLGANLLLSQMPAVARMLARIRGTWLHRDELEPAWRAWRAHRFPVFSVR